MTDPDRSTNLADNSPASAGNRLRNRGACRCWSSLLLGLLSILAS